MTDVTERLTEGQRALWFLHELDPGSPKYIIARAATIRGPLDPAVLAQAFNAVGDRHPALRTTFEAIEGEPRRVVGARSAPQIEVHDASAWDEPALHTRLRAAAYRPFDLERGPLWRVIVFVRGEREHVLLLAMHHIIADFWSLTLVFDEVRQLFAAGAVAGTDGIRAASAALPPAGDPDAVVRQGIDYLASPAFAADLAWWQAQLEGAPAELAWPTSGQGPRAPASEVPQLDFRLGGELRERVEALSRRLGVSLHAPLLAAFYVLLSRWTGQQDLVVGVPSAVRRSEAARRLIGYSVNALPIRAQLSAASSFAELVTRAGAATRGALAHQLLPFATLVERARRERTAASNPIFQAMFGFHRAFAKELEVLGEFAIGAGTSELPWGPATISVFPLAVGDAPVDVNLTIAPIANDLACTLEYDVAKFDRAAIERMASQYARLLASLIDEPDQSVARAHMMSDAEVRQVVAVGNDTARPYPSGARLHELVEEQVRRTPSAIAIVAGAVQLTYAELDAQADRLAAQLLARGVTPEARVGILARRSADLIVAMLAVLKSGGAYVPLDPAYPLQRLEYIAQHSRIRALIVDRELRDRLALPDCAYVVLEDLRDAPMPAALPPVSGSSDRLAYVLYTSGSTGTPKGVCLTHRNAVNFVSWVAATFSRDEMAGVLASTSVCFDLSVFEIFGTLHRGGRMILVDDALGLLDCAAAAEVTLVNTVPAAMAELVGTRGVPDSVRTITMCGEILHRSLVRRAYAETRASRVVNLYGPTETTTYSTVAEMSRDDVDVPTIGLPIDNTRVYLLDGELEPVAEGMRGELYIGGDGVARGYEHQPALTAARFVPDPFVGVPGARMYCTGDIAVRRPDGQLHFVGRVDHQIKLRGFRIELGEIESRLLLHPAVPAAVATVWTGGGEPRLVAHVVVNPGHIDPIEPALRSHLRAALPEYMVPEHFVVCAALPYTPNGKVDRARLPAPSRAPAADPHVAPRDELEARIQQIWSDALGGAVVGVEDNFFALGGSSLLAARLASQLHQGLGVRVTVRDVFEHPTVATLAARLRTGPTERANDAIPILPRVPFRSARGHDPT